MNSSYSAQASISAISKELADFSYKIEQCFQQSLWDDLSQVLAARLCYLEGILSEPLDAEVQTVLKTIIENLLVQDQLSVAKINEQKSQLLELNLLCDKGMRAVKAYVQY